MPKAKIHIPESLDDLRKRVEELEAEKAERRAKKAGSMAKYRARLRKRKKPEGEEKH